jgi:hypothetical protein
MVADAPGPQLGIAFDRNAVEFEHLHRRASDAFVGFAMVLKQPLQRGGIVLRLAVYRLAVPAVPAGGANRQLHRRPIILAAAPCTAMVFVWSNLTDGDANFTLSPVALNDTIMVFAFAPIVALLLGLSSITVPWTTLFISVVLYIVVPVIAAQLWRQSLLAQGEETAVARTLRSLQPISLIALLATLVLLFGFQGEQIPRRHREHRRPGPRCRTCSPISPSRSAARRDKTMDNRRRRPRAPVHCGFPEALAQGDPTRAGPAPSYWPVGFWPAAITSRIRMKAVSENLGCFDLPKVNTCRHWGFASIPSCSRSAWD